MPKSFRAGSTPVTESSWVSPPKRLQKKNSLMFTRLPDENRRSAWQRGAGRLDKSGGKCARGRGAARRRDSSSPAPENVARGRDVPSVSIRVCSRKLNSPWDDPMFEAEDAGEALDATDWGDEEGDEGGVITVSRDGRKIYCPDDDLINIKDYDFDSVFPVSATSAKVYAARIANLTPHVANGGHACIVVSGDAAHAKVATALGRRCGPHRSANDAIQESDLGVIHFAVAQVLSYLDKDQLERQDSASAVGKGAKSMKRKKRKKKRRKSIESEGSDYDNDADKSPSVTLTWYELVGRSSIRDVLCAVSRGEGDGPTQGLSMCDTVGSGVHVPDLLEVEVKNVGDVHRVLQRIRAKDYDESPTGASLRHSVLSINVKQYNGRLDVVLLGSPFRDDLNDGAASPVSFDDDESEYSGDGASAPPRRTTWSRELMDAVRACSHPNLQKLVPSDLFDMSCLLLLLREPVLGRVPSTWIECVECTIDAAAYTLESVRGAQLIYNSTRKKKTRSLDEQSITSSEDDEAESGPMSEEANDDPSDQRGEEDGPVLHRASSSIANPTVAASKPRPSRSAPNAPSNMQRGKDRVVGADAAEATAEQVEANQRPSSSSSEAFNFAVSSKEMTSFAISKLQQISEQEGAQASGGMDTHQLKRLVPWFKNILKTNREKKAEVQELKTRVEAMQRRLKRANNSYAVLSSAASKAKQGRSGDGSSSLGKGSESRTVQGLRAQLKKTQNELHDFAVYKDVMEATLARVNSEMSAARTEREKAVALVRKLKGRLKNRAVVSSSRGMDELRTKLAAVTKEKQTLTVSLEAERKARMAAERKAKQATQQAENSADAVEMLVNEQQRLTAELEVANRRTVSVKSSPSSSSPKFGMSKVEELQRSVAMLEARNTQLQRQLKQTKSAGDSARGTVRRGASSVNGVASGSFAAPTASSSRKVNRVRVSLKKTSTTAKRGVTSASNMNIAKHRRGKNANKKSDRRAPAESSAKESSRMKEEEEDDVNGVGEEEVAAALAALDDGGIVEPYESNGGEDVSKSKSVEQDGPDDDLDDLDGELSTAAVLERLRKQRMETQEFLNSRQRQGT
eukprot:g520.t1